MDGFAAERARWLGEIAEALEGARARVKQLGAAEGRVEAIELYARIEAVRAEVEAMRRGRGAAAREMSSPEWSNNLPWQHRFGTDRQADG